MFELETPHEEFRMFVTIPKNRLLLMSQGAMGLLLLTATFLNADPATAGNFADTASGTTPTGNVTGEVQDAAESSQLNWPTARGDCPIDGPR